MLSKPIHLSETEESGLSCVGVKSVDLRRSAKSEGSSLGLYWRWGVKTWGENKIRYPSSPCRKRWVFALGLHGSGVQVTRETLCLGSTVARSKLKGIDRGVHKRWSMWFNLIQRTKPYQPLIYEQKNLPLMGWYITFIQVLHGYRQLMLWDVWSSPITSETLVLCCWDMRLRRNGNRSEPGSRVTCQLPYLTWVPARSCAFSKNFTIGSRRLSKHFHVWTEVVLRHSFPTETYL